MDRDDQHRGQPRQPNDPRGSEESEALSPSSREDAERPHTPSDEGPQEEGGSDEEVFRAPGGLGQAVDELGAEGEQHPGDGTDEEA